MYIIDLKHSLSFGTNSEQVAQCCAGPRRAIYCQEFDYYTVPYIRILYIRDTSDRDLFLPCPRMSCWAPPNI